MSYQTATPSSGDAVKALRSSRRIVVKVGSSLLVDDAGALKKDWLSGLADDLFALRQNGSEVIVVTSGAIALGRTRLGYSSRLSLDESQAASAAGQALLIEGWQDALSVHGLIVAQVLITLADTEDRRRYLNARATLRALLKAGAIPVINENDTVATAEIRYGDNDRLAAHAAQLANADLVVLLSDVDGLYTAHPDTGEGATHLAIVNAITPEISSMAAGPNTQRGVGSGGMVTKLEAAKIATGNGCALMIARGSDGRPLKRLLDGARSTYFPAAVTPARARKQWIANRLKPAGAIRIDDGASQAIRGGASLLPAGIRVVEGDFYCGDAVRIETLGGVKLGQGIISFDAAELRLALGRKSQEIDELLGYRRRAAAIDRSDIVLDSD